MTSEDSGLGGGADNTVSSTAEKILAANDQQPTPEQASQHQDSLSLDGDTLDEKKQDTHGSTTEITSEKPGNSEKPEKNGGRLAASRQSSSRSVSRSEKVEVPPVKDSPEVASKKQEIRDACLQGNFARLKELAGSEGGFLTDDLRQIACTSRSLVLSPSFFFLSF